MNNDLISKAGLGVDFCNPDVFENKAYAEGWNSLIKIIKDAPAVDAEPVRHGRWMENIVEDVRAYPPYSYKNGYKCSLCGRKTRSKKEPYCHCGAKMDAEV